MESRNKIFSIVLASVIAIFVSACAKDSMMNNDDMMNDHGSMKNMDNMKDKDMM